MADWFDENSPPQATQPQPDWFAQNAPKPVEERSIPSKIGHAVLDTVKGFLPQSVEDAALAPITMFPGVGQVYKSLSNIAFGRPASEGISPVAGIPVVQRIPEIIRAEKTPALSQERFTTGAGVVADLAMIAGFKGALHPEIAPKLAEVAGIAKPEVPPETVTPEPITPVATDTATATPIVPEVAPSVPAAESVVTAPLSPETSSLGKVEPVAPDLPTGTGEGVTTKPLGSTAAGLLDAWDKNPNDPVLGHVIKRTLESLSPEEREAGLTLRNPDLFASPVSEAPVSTTATPLTQTERSISGNKTPVAQTEAARTGGVVGRVRKFSDAWDERGLLESKALMSPSEFARMQYGTVPPADVIPTLERNHAQVVADALANGLRANPEAVAKYGLKAPSVSVEGQAPTAPLSTETPIGGIEDAISKSSTGEILQRQPEETGTTGGQRVGVEQGVQGEKPAETLQTATPQEQVIPEGAKANVTVRDANGEPVQLQNVDAKQWETKFTERKSAYEKLMECLG